MEADTRQAALDILFGLLKVAPDQAHVDPSRTLVQIGQQLWTLVAAAQKAPPAEGNPSLRRAGAKHKRVR